MQSQLAKHIATSMDCYQIKYDAWHKERILVIASDDIMKLSDKEYAIVSEIANRLYAKGRA
jgi:sulfur relay (sulfurtransferase) DsrC/TusE family protein